MENPLFSKRKTVREYLKEHLVSILYTVIVHLLVFIVLMFVKVSGLKEDRELGVMLDFTHEEQTEPEQQEVALPADWLEQVYRARERASNQAVNTAKAEEFQEKISTNDYVNEVKNELEAQRDDAFLKERERLNEILNRDEWVEPESAQEPEKEQKEFKGPTTITYEFSEAPLNRGKISLEIPVYRCEGGALVKVAVTVDQSGYVTAANVLSVSADAGTDCFHQAALGAALNSRFRPDMTAPVKHRAVITYTFISQ